MQATNIQDVWPLDTGHTISGSHYLRRNPHARPRRHEPLRLPESICSALFFSATGRVSHLTAYRITDAIAQAGHATNDFDRAIAEQLTRRVLAIASATIAEDDVPTVEDMQDIAEDVLLASPYKAAAKAFIVYREQHARIRDIATQTQSDLLSAYLDKRDWWVAENANMAYSLQGLNNYVASEVTKTYWLNTIYPQ